MRSARGGRESDYKRLRKLDRRIKRVAKLDRLFKISKFDLITFMRSARGKYKP